MFAPHSNEFNLLGLSLVVLEVCGVAVCIGKRRCMSACGDVATWRRGLVARWRRRGCERVSRAARRRRRGRPAERRGAGRPAHPAAAAAAPAPRGTPRPATPPGSASGPRCLRGEPSLKTLRSQIF